MSIAIWIAIAAGLLAASAPITWGGLRKVDEKELDKYVRRVGLPLPDHMRRPLVQRIVARERWASWGGAAALIVALVVSLAAGWVDSEGGALLIVAVTLGASLGGVLAILTGQHEFAPGAPRVARTQQTGMADYVTIAQRWGSRLCVLPACLAAGVGTILLGQLPGIARELNGGWLWFVWGSVAVTAVSALVAELVGRWVLLRPQHAETKLELAWDDICRADSLRALFTNPPALGILSCFVSFMMVGVSVIAPEVRAGAMEQTLVFGFVMLGVTLALVCVLLIPSMTDWAAGSRRRHVLQHLWSDQNFTADARERAC